MQNCCVIKRLKLYLQTFRKHWRRRRNVCPILKTTNNQHLFCYSKSKSSSILPGVDHLPRKVTNERRFGISWYREIARRISLYSRVALPLAFLLSQGHHPKSYGGKMAKRFTTTTISIIFRENISTGFCSSTKFLRNIRGIIHVQRFPRLRWSVCRPPPTSQWKVCFKVVCCY